MSQWCHLPACGQSCAPPFLSDWSAVLVYLVCLQCFSGAIRFTAYPPRLVRWSIPSTALALIPLLRPRSLPWCRARLNSSRRQTRWRRCNAIHCWHCASVKGWPISARQLPRSTMISAMCSVRRRWLPTRCWHQRMNACAAWLRISCDRWNSL